MASIGDDDAIPIDFRFHDLLPCRARHLVRCESGRRLAGRLYRCGYPGGLTAEFDALYRRIGFDRARFGGDPTLYTDRERANSWSSRFSPSTVRNRLVGHAPTCWPALGSHRSSAIRVGAGHSERATAFASSRQRPAISFRCSSASLSARVTRTRAARRPRSCVEHPERRTSTGAPGTRLPMSPAADARRSCRCWGRSPSVRAARRSRTCDPRGS